MGEKDDVEAATQPTSAKDWNGPNDPSNPWNWPTWKKYYHTAIPTAIAFLCPFGSSVYTPGSDQVQKAFGVSREVALLPFCFYLLGLSFGPVLAGPVSETFGRKVVYLSGLPIFGLFTLGAGFSNGIASLIITRFFAGMFSSPGLSIGTGTISDIYPQDKRGVPLALYVGSVQMGPALGPLIGGAVVETMNWRWTQWVMLFGLVIVIAFTLRMEETYKKCILKARAKKLNIEGPPEPERTRMETIRFFATKTIIRPLHMLFTEPIVAAFDVYVAFNFGLLNAFFAAFSYVFETIYGYNLVITGLTYLGQAVGSIIGFLIMYYVYKVTWANEAEETKENGKPPPEKRLLFAKIGAPMVPIALFWFGWTADYHVFWLSPVIAEAVFSCGNMLIFTTASIYITQCYGALYGASAWSSNTFLRYLFATVFPLFAVQMYENLGTGWATSLLAFLTMLLVPIPFIFDIYGKRIRAKSKYTSSE